MLYSLSDFRRAIRLIVKQAKEYLSNARSS